MTSAFTAVSASTTNNMTFTAYKFTNFYIVDICTKCFHCSNIFMSNVHWNRNSFLSPFIPVVNMNICSTDRCFVNFN